MDAVERVRKLRALSPERVRAEKQRQSVIGQLKKALTERGHRADLHLVASKPSADGFYAEVRFNKQLGHPSDQDLKALVTAHFKGHQIDWNSASVNLDEGVVELRLSPTRDVIPLDSAKNIPPGFTPIGTGIFRRKVAQVTEIWELRRGDSGPELVRKVDDIEVQADAAPQLKVGDVVNTPYGAGAILRFDEAGNAFVRIGKNVKLAAAVSMEPYSLEKEKDKVFAYYKELYGEAYAKMLVENFSSAEEM